MLSRNRHSVGTVTWTYAGLSTLEMEQRVTTGSQYSIRASVNGIKNIEAQAARTVSGFTSFLHRNPQAGLPCNRAPGSLAPSSAVDTLES
jgi:hypothetical protein